MTRAVELRLRAPNAEEQAAKQAAARLWAEDRARLVLAQPFLALLAMQLDLVPVVDSRVRTACTDGERVYVNAMFLGELSAHEREFVLAHEVWHCALRHFVRRGGRDAERWNIAADHEVNALLREQGMRLPEGCILLDGQRGRNAEQVYDWLGGRNELPDRGRLADDHRTPVCDGVAEGVVDSDFRAAASDGVWDRWRDRVVAAAQQVARGRGTLPAGIARLVESYRNPRVPWPQVLRAFLSRANATERRWYPPSRRFVAQGLYLPGFRGDCLDIAVAVDTSGSTRGERTAFVSEVLGILKSFGRFRVRLLSCDAAIHEDRVFTDAEPYKPEDLRLRGCGGTDFRPVFDRLADSPPQALVYFTDGHGPAPQAPSPWPVIWALTAGGLAPAAWGAVLHTSSRI